MSRRIQNFFYDESAVTAIEYALLAGGIAIVILTAVDAAGNAINRVFANVAAGF